MERKNTQKPEFVEKFVKPRNTEIKHIGNNWYLYERLNRYDASIRRSRKVSGQCIGKITEQGLVPSKRRMVKAETMTVKSVVDVGSSLYLWDRTAEIRQRLQRHFPSDWERIYVAALVRAFYEPRFKRLQLHFEESFLSVLFPSLRFGATDNSAMLRNLGRNREKISAFMQEDVKKHSKFILFDGHRLITASKGMPFGELGYDSKRRFKPQINLLYAYSLAESSCAPVYYKQFNGSTPDVKAFPDLLKEMAISNKGATIVADKGFGSEEDFSLIEDVGLGYVIPLRRGNRFVKDGLPAAPSGYDDGFVYHGRAIQYKEYPQEGFNVFLYFDTQLFADEMEDYCERLEKQNNTNEIKAKAENKRILQGKGRLSAEELEALKPVKLTEIFSQVPEIGTVSIRTNRTDLNGCQVYCIYKQRQAVEQFFKLYSDTMEFEASYMRDQTCEEGWLFLNHLSSIIGTSCIESIAAIGESKNISLDDIRQTMNKIRACKIGSTWQIEPIKKQTQKLLSKIDMEVTSEALEALIKVRSSAT